MSKTKVKKEVKSTSSKKTAPSKPKKPKAPKYELVAFEIGAVVPTQMYGHISPKITVRTKTIEEARELVMPVIEELYLKYAEKPRDGSSLSFGSRANVTATERKVVPPSTPAPKAETPAAPKPASEPDPARTATPKPPAPAPVKTAQEELDEFANDLAKSTAFTKAENAIRDCSSLAALSLIEDQIQKSVKLTSDEKPPLFEAVLKRRKDFEL